MSEQKKTYVGNGKKVGTGGIRAAINVTKLMNAMKEGACNTFEGKTGDKFATVVIWENQQPDQYGNTHVVVCDTFKPDPEKKLNSTAQAVVAKIDGASDLPL